MDMMNGKQLSDARADMGWTQGRLGDFLGLTRVTVNRMENNTQGIDRRTAMAVLYHAPMNEEREALLDRYLRGFEMAELDLAI